LEYLPSIRRSLQLIVLISLFVTAYFAKDLILPIVLGFLLALTLSPVGRGLHRVGVPHPVSAFLLVTATTLVIAAVVLLSAGTVAIWSDEIPQMGREIQIKLSGVSSAVETMRSASEEVQKLGTDTATTPQEVVVRQPGLLDTAMDTVSKTGASLAVILILALFLLGSGELFYLKLVQAMPTLKEKKRALHTVYAVEKRVSRYLLTIATINAILGILVGTYLTILGLPSAYIWGIAAFMLNFLPYIGGFAGVLLVAGFSLVTFDTVGYAMLAPIGYLTLTLVEGQIITPWLVGRRLEMNTVAVFLTVVFWGWLWGIPGALVAVPFLVVFKVVCENFEPLHTIGSFLSAEQVKPDDMRDQAAMSASE
jgi:predicted PurR-regulated permease PerM|tara:strand:+ start:4043 stop:5140 length:1098 start_codon:yes stop_codon:yes gene_type:complete